jgi:hypothetical protein
MEIDSTAFNAIRAYTDEEVPSVIERLTNEKPFMKLLSTIFPLLPKDILKKRLLQIKTTNEFQKEIVFPFLESLIANKTKGVDLSGLDKVNLQSNYLFMSNHRDIVIDPAFFGGKLIEEGLDTMEIAIGNNLLIFPWIEDLVRMNKAFIVKRGEKGQKGFRDMQLLSDYILFTIRERKRSIWLAQREGRAKDGNDRTQESLLKMLNLAGKSDFIDNIKELNICPLSISYEYDPCDFLKAKELQQRRDNPAFKKNPEDDLSSMGTGVMGYKGKVVFALTGCINDELDELKRESLNTDRNALIEKTAALINKKIHLAYTIFKNNKMAYDILLDAHRFEKDYTVSERTDFENYISKQLNKIGLEKKDDDFLRKTMLEMYANPLINQLKAQGI